MCVRGRTTHYFAANDHAEYASVLGHERLPLAAAPDAGGLDWTRARRNMPLHRTAGTRAGRQILSVAHSPAQRGAVSGQRGCCHLRRLPHPACPVIHGAALLGSDGRGGNRLGARQYLVRCRARVCPTDAVRRPDGTANSLCHHCRTDRPREHYAHPQAAPPSKKCERRYVCIHYDVCTSGAQGPGARRAMVPAMVFGQRILCRTLDVWCGGAA
mmetsp:Transcript_23721/g.60657  ORF Transcript_23721/g.60657 Transcript_23721/m.60657 type:complete len:214 (-) Transcript_23721:706-1347(-)